MDKPLRDEMPEGHGKSRRQFLQLVTGATANAVAALPAMAQENVERPGAGNASPNRRGSIAETLADYAVSLRYEDLPTIRGTLGVLQRAVRGGRGADVRRDR